MRRLVRESGMIIPGRVSDRAARTGRKCGRRRDEAAQETAVVTHIALDRQFVPWREEEGGAVHRLKAMRSGLEELGWEELRRQRRVVVLAEAGSGKSAELEEQARLLTAQGKSSFFTTLSAISAEGLAAALAAESRDRLAAWRASSEPAWFFVDSVDEAKHSGVQLAAALHKLSEGLGAGLRQAHVILSGRITDWEFRTDLARLSKLLPVPAEGVPLGPPSSEELLVRALRTESGREREAQTADSDVPLVVIMTPLDERRVRLFASSSGISDAQEFIKAIDAADLWFLAQRPLDLQWLVAYWKRRGCLGTLESMIESSLVARLQETNLAHARDDSIDQVRAMQGIERVGAAMVFCRMDKIGVEDSALSLAPTHGALRLAEVLPDWTPNERRRLLTRAVFDPATYGCVRLHNDNEGTVRAFLTARWVRRLLGPNGSTRVLMPWLFADQYGYALIRPSMRLTSAWLALRDPDVAREVIAREPELLLTEGDPGSLPASARRAVLLRVIEALANTGSLGIIDDGVLRRIAVPDLVSTIRELWALHAKRPACRILLLRLIEVGRLSACKDLAAEAVMNLVDDDVARVHAGRALLAIGDREQVKAYAQLIRVEANRLPGRVLWEALDQLSPGWFSVEEFLSAVRAMAESVRTPWPGLDYFVPRYAARLRSRADLERLLTGILEFVTVVEASEENFEVESDRTHVATLVTIACALMSYIGPAEVPSLVIDIALRARSAHRVRTVDGMSRDLVEHLTQTRERRRAVFWHVARSWATHAMLHGHPLESVSAMAVLGWAPGLEISDLGWLLTDAVDTPVPREARLAVDAALQLWKTNGQRPEELERIKSHFADKPELVAAVEQWLTPRQPEPLEIAFNRERASREADRASQQREIESSWLSFIAELKENPEQLRHLPVPSNGIDVRLFHLWTLLSHRDRRSSSRYAIDDLTPVEGILGPELTAAFQGALIRFWREWKPTLESARPPNERQLVNRADLVGICGVSIEAALQEGWPKYLHSAEAERAAEYATLELNGFPVWTARLAAAWPQEVGRVLLGEVIAQIDATPQQALGGPLQDLETASLEICSAVAEGLYRAFREREALPERVLSRVLSILIRGLSSAGGDGLLALLTERGARAADPGIASCYFAAAFYHYPGEALVALRAALNGSEGPRRRALVEALLPRLFGNAFRPSDDAALELPVEIMEQLVKIAFDEVRVNEDVDHTDGKVFSPGPREMAEQARNALFRRLIQMPGPETVEAFRRLGAHPGFPVSGERIEELCRARAAEDSEGEVWPLDAAFRLERGQELPPATAAELQALATSRLEDIAYDLRNGDFTLGTIFKDLHDETDVQRWVADELRTRQGEAYSVEREPHVADEKAPDIRIRSRVKDLSLPIEVKDTASGWSLPELEEGLNEQLGGRYLRARNCQYGIYLIVHRQARVRGWSGHNGQMLSFAEVIAHLREIAARIASGGATAPQMQVCVIDVSNI